MIGFLVLMVLMPKIGHAEKIQSFNDEIVVKNNATLQVTETIIYDFEGASRHGIFRDIPLDNSDGSSLSINSVSVVDDQGSAYQKSITEDSNGLHIKIGSPSILVSGVKTYKISYQVENALVSFNNYDELYWNATGNSWVVPIDYAKISVTSPEVVQSSCYQGSEGSHASCLASNEAKHLVPGEGVTIAVGFKRELFQELKELVGK
jgi:hypothetical protein